MCKLLKTLANSFYTLFIIYYFFLLSDTEYYEEISLVYHSLGPGHEYIKPAFRGFTHQKLNYTPPKFREFRRLKTDFKYILRWSRAFSHYSSVIFTSGQLSFIARNCSQRNCYITDNKGLLGDSRYFDAILFDVENDWDKHPELRAPYQKYIFIASESAANYPVCSEYFDSYYNWTWTYKVDSDIRWSFVTVVDLKGNVVGPKANMSWVEDMKPVPDKVKKRVSKKNKAAAWFVSNCGAKSGRDGVAKGIQEALAHYNLTVDIYGWCGALTCTRDRLEDCLEMLQINYYFYLSFENSLSVDYVTEKILYPLEFYAVPIVYGGADYGRFLPPGSYLNAGIHNATTIARKMYEAITNSTIYYQYFRWHNHYKFVERPPEPDICQLCSMLHDPTHLSHSVYSDFRKWWLSDYKKVCS